jgi:predicted  nucleic acid-binding Zn-ribbon protein
VLEEKSTSIKGTKDNASTEEPTGELSLPEIDESALDDLDPSIADLIKSQNAALKALSAEVTSLKKAGNTAEAKGFFETQYGALDEKVRSHVDAVKKTQLKQKFDLLEKGYKAAGEKVDRETIFKEAVSITLSDAMAKAAAEAKSAKVASRKGLVIAPPGGSSGKTTKVVGCGEYADIIAALQEKGFE